MTDRRYGRGMAATHRTLAGFVVAVSAALFAAGGADARVWPAQGEFTNDAIVDTLGNLGYTDVFVISIGRRLVIAEGCRDGRRYRVQVDRAYRTRVIDELGFCSATGRADPSDPPRYDDPPRYGDAPEDAISFADLQALIARRGYRDLEIRGVYKAAACAGGASYDLDVYAFGRVDHSRGRYAGRCDAAEGGRGATSGAETGATGGRFEPSLDAVYAKLAAAGYAAPRFKLPMTVTACNARERRTLEITADRGGYASATLGAYVAPCVSDDDAPAGGGGDGSPGDDTLLSPSAVRAMLREQGYRRVFIDERLAKGYRASACFAVRRFEMTVRVDGFITARKASGFCRLGEEGVEIVAKRPVSNSVLNSDTPLDPATCQSVLNWFQANRPITFRSGSDELDPQGAAIIRRMAQGVDRCGDVSILVEGHTDGTGDRYQNQLLSEKRARKVASLLIANGVDPSRVRARGYGMDHPVASNDNFADRALNRRIELNLEWRLD